MELILWRHCDAEPGVPDDLRPLTPKGMDQAARMAQWLAPRLPAACRILVSPAVRAQQTAQALNRAYRTTPELATGASVADVLEVAEWPDSEQPVLVIGHQPTLGVTASFLLAGEETDRAMRTGALWWLTGRSRAGAAAAVLKIAIDPDSV